MVVVVVVAVVVVVVVVVAVALQVLFHSARKCARNGKCFVLLLFAHT